MKTIFVLFALFLTHSGWAQTATSTGIALDTAWKKQVYAFAVKNVVHPSWGLTHSERDYQTTVKLAAAEGFALDLDVLFAAAFLHDLGGLEGFEKEGVDHAVRSVELAQGLLQGWGFPMQKWPQVKSMILGHTYYGTAPTALADQAFRDADVLDFLGAMGVSRILAVAFEGKKASSLKPSIDILKNFQTSMPQKLLLKTSQSRAQPLIEEMDHFLKAVNEASLQGSAL